MEINTIFYLIGIVTIATFLIILVFYVYYATKEKKYRKKVELKYNQEEEKFLKNRAMENLNRELSKQLQEKEAQQQQQDRLNRRSQIKWR